MIRRPVYKVDAFTRTPLRGNPAGVVPFARGLGASEMLAVARELAVPETAFVFPSRDADVKLRFFTPTQEVPFCGHALVGALALLAELGEVQIPPGRSARVRVETGVGVLAVEVRGEAGGVRVEMTQTEPAFRPWEGEVNEVLEILGADPEDLRLDLPLELAYTGLWHLLVPLRTVDAVDGLMPDFRALAELNRELGAVTTHVFAEGDGGYHCRGFAPAAGVDEDPVTGSASGALGAYLVRHGAVRASAPLLLNQGDACDRPGTVSVTVGGTPEAPGPVVVGGDAVVSLRGEICLGDDA